MKRVYLVSGPLSRLPTELLRRYCKSVLFCHDSYSALRQNAYLGFLFHSIAVGHLFERITAAVSGVFDDSVVRSNARS